MEKITFQTLLDEKGEEPKYTPRPGLQYEVAGGSSTSEPGCVVAMKLPTMGVQRAFLETMQRLREEGGDAPDVVLARLATEGEWPESDAVVPQMAARIVTDFLFFAQQISGLRTTSAAESSPSASSEETAPNL